MSKKQRVHVPNTWVLGFGAKAIIVWASGKTMITRYLDPYGLTAAGN